MDDLNHYYQKSQDFRLSSVFQDHVLNLTIFQNEKAWQVTVTKDEMIKQSKEDLNDFYDKLKKYLNTCPSDVELDFILGKFTINILLKNKMKVLFFAITLKEVNFSENVFYLVDKLYNDRTQSFKAINYLKKEYSTLKEDNKNLKNKMDLFLERKNTEEQRLYTMFTAMLNEKKRHIQHLNDLLIAFKKKGPSAIEQHTIKKENNGHSSKFQKNPKRKSSIEEEAKSSSSTSDNNYNTDSEREDSNDKINEIPPERDLSVPSTSKMDTSFIEKSQITLSGISKRIRTNNLHSSVRLLDKKSTESNPIKSEDITNDTKTKNKLSPTVNFSTQDLLDNL